MSALTIYAPLSRIALSSPAERGDLQSTRRTRSPGTLPYALIHKISEFLPLENTASFSGTERNTRAALRSSVAFRQREQDRISRYKTEFGASRREVSISFAGEVTFSRDIPLTRTARKAYCLFAMAVMAYLLLSLLISSSIALAGAPVPALIVMSILAIPIVGIGTKLFESWCIYRENLLHLMQTPPTSLSFAQCAYLYAENQKKLLNVHDVQARQDDDHITERLLTKICNILDASPTFIMPTHVVDTVSRIIDRMLDQKQHWCAGARIRNPQIREQICSDLRTKLYLNPRFRELVRLPAL